MVGVYKFLHAKDLHFWMEERSIKIDTLASFARPRSDGGYGDAMEVVAKGGFSDPAELTYSGGHSFVRFSESPNEQTLVENLRCVFGISIQNSSFTTVINPRVRLPNGFAFCASLEFSKSVFRRWHEIEGYDTAVYIPDLHRFLNFVHEADIKGSRKLMTRGVVSQAVYLETPLDLRNVRLRTFRPNQLGSLRTADIGPGFLCESGFIKDVSRFGWQKEARIIWQPGIPEDEPPYKLKIPDLHHVFRLKRIPVEWF